MSVILVVHEHVCDNCITAWKHVDEKCDRNYKKVLTCNTCAPVTQIWTEMARNMPIPHTHTCVICENEWEHNDKKCAIEEHYWLECEPCMTFLFMHPCPKCGTESEEIGYTAQDIRYVCPKCRHYFAPKGQEVFTAKAHVCPRCGKEARKMKTTPPDSLCYACADCEYYFYAQNEDVSAAQESAQPNSTCSRCGTRFVADENSLGICSECGYWFRLHNGNQHQDETDEYDEPTGVG